MKKYLMIILLFLITINFYGKKIHKKGKCLVKGKINYYIKKDNTLYIGNIIIKSNNLNNILKKGGGSIGYIIVKNGKYKRYVGRNNDIRLKDKYEIVKTYIQFNFYYDKKNNKLTIFEIKNFNTKVWEVTFL